MNVLKLKKWRRPFAILMVSIMLFTSISFTTSSVVSYAVHNESNIESVEANFIRNLLDSLANLAEKVGDVMDASAVSEAIADKDAEGVTSRIAPHEYQSASVGPFGEDKPFEGLEDDEVATKFLAFQYWSSEYSVRSFSGMGSMGDIMSSGAKSIGRFLGGPFLLVISLVGHGVEFIGDFVYQTISVFNIFKYVTPDESEGSLLSPWVYDDDGANALGAFFGDWVNLGRLIGYLSAVVIFVIGLALSVLGYRMGNSQTISGSIMGTIKRLVISVFTITGAVLMLSGIITSFGERMTASSDELSVSSQISGLILNYKDMVTLPYTMVPNTSAYVDSFDIPSLTAVENLYETGGTLSKKGTISREEIRNINKELGYSTEDNTTRGLEGIDTFANSIAYELIEGWMKGSSTTSSEIEATYGDESYPLAVYRTRTSDGQMTVEDRGWFSTKYSYFDFTLPGGIIGFLRMLNFFVQTVLISIFAWRVYMSMFQSMFTMVRRVIVQLPATAMLGSGSSLFLMAGAVIVMMLELVIGRVVIMLFVDIVGSIDILFPAITELISDAGVEVLSSISSGGFLPMGTILPFASIETLSQNLIHLIVLAIGGYFALKGFTGLVAGLGSSIDNFFVDLAGRIAGLNVNDVRKPKSKSNQLSGSTSSEDGLMSVTTTESETDSISGYNESQSAMNTSSSNMIGAVGSYSAESGMAFAGYSPDDPEDADYSDSGVSSESVLGGGPGIRSISAEEEAAIGGALGISDGAGTTGMGEEVTSSTTSSSTTGSMGSSGADQSMVGDSEVSGDMDDMESLGDTEDERTHTSRVAFEQELEEDALASASEMGTTGSDESLDQDRTLSGSERISRDMDQVVDDVAGSGDASLEGSTSTVEVDADDLEYEYSAVDNTNAQDALGSDGASNVGAGVGADNEEHISMAGADQSVVFDQEGGGSQVGDTLRGDHDYNEIADEFDIGQDTDTHTDGSVHQDATDDDIELTVDAEDSVVDAHTRAGDTNREVGDFNTDGVGRDQGSDINYEGYNLAANDDQVTGQSRVNADGTIDAEFEEIVDDNSNANINVTALDGSQQVNDSMNRTDATGNAEAYANDSNTEGYNRSGGSESISDTSRVSDSYDTNVTDDVYVDTEGTVSTAEVVQAGNNNVSDVNASAGAIPVQNTQFGAGGMSNANFSGAEAMYMESNSTSSRVSDSYSTTNNDTTTVDTDGSVSTVNEVTQGSESVSESESSSTQMYGSRNTAQSQASFGAVGAGTADTDVSNMSRVSDDYMTNVSNNAVADSNNNVSVSDAVSPGNVATSNIGGGGAVAGAAYSSSSGDFGYVEQNNQSASSSNSQRSGFKAESTKTKTTTKTYANPSSGGDSSSGGYNVGSSGGTGRQYRQPVAGGYIDHKGNFHRTSSSALANDVGKLFDGVQYEGTSNANPENSSSSPTPVPVMRNRAVNSGGSSDSSSTGDSSSIKDNVSTVVNKVRRGKGSSSKPSSTSSYETTQVVNEVEESSSSSTSGLFGRRDGSSQVEVSSDSSYNVSSRSSESRSTGSTTTSSDSSPKFGRR